VSESPSGSSADEAELRVESAAAAEGPADILRNSEEACCAAQRSLVAMRNRQYFSL